MKDNLKESGIEQSASKDRRNLVGEFIERFKRLSGDPHYVATGMAIGVFVSMTPTIPFHTAIALALALVFRGSKAAAAIGVWFSNPVTIPFFYLGSYKFGMFILGKSIPFDARYESISELMKLGMDATAAMIIGGAILGIVPGIAAYFITLKMIKTIRARKEKKAQRLGAKDEK